MGKEIKDKPYWIYRDEPDKNIASEYIETYGDYLRSVPPSCPVFPNTFIKSFIGESSYSYLGSWKTIFPIINIKR